MGRDLVLVIATQNRGAGPGLGFVRWGSVARQRQPRPFGSAARDGRAASAAVFTAARGQVCGWEKAQALPVVPGRLEVRLEACTRPPACEDLGGPGNASPRPKGSGVASGQGLGWLFEGPGSGELAGQEG